MPKGKIEQLIEGIKAELKLITKDNYPNVTEMIEQGNGNAVVQSVLRSVENSGMTIKEAINNLEKNFSYEG